VTCATPIRRRLPAHPGRYAHLFRPAERTEIIARIQAAADRNIARFKLLPEKDNKNNLAERTVVLQPENAEQGK
jgi:pyruvate ferredoxin oxidoreductase beta subunit